MNIILASQSPRRKEILLSLGIEFDVVLPDADESADIKSPAALVLELSKRKVRAARSALAREGADISDTLIIASDTVVLCGGEILGKPKDRADARAMLASMSGKSHTVLSGIAVIWGDREAADLSETEVRFAKMSEREIEWYLDTGEYADKAGAYGVQGAAALFIEGIVGDYFTVVGLPVRKLSELLLREFGISLCDISDMSNMSNMSKNAAGQELS